MTFFLRAENYLPSIGLLIVCGLVLFSPLLDGGTTHLAAMIMRLLILFGVAIGCFNAVMTRQWTLPNWPINVPIAAFMGIAGVSTALSSYTNQSAQWMVVCLSYAGFLYLLAAFVRRWEDVQALRTTLLGSAFCQAIIAMTQTYQGQARPTGTFFNPNFLAGYLAVASIIVLSSLAFKKYGHCRHRTNRRGMASGALSLGGLVIVLAALFQTGSRGGALALLLGAAVVIVLRFGRRGVAGLALLVAVAVLTPNPIHDRVVAEHVFNPAAYARWQMWQSAVQEMTEHPFGVGLGLYQYTYPRYAFPIEEDIFRYGKVAHTPHNEFVQIGVELGVIGLGVFLWGLARVARDMRRLFRHRLSRDQRGVMVGMGGACVVILAQAAVDSNLHEPALAIVLALCVAVLSLGRTVCSQEGRHQWTIMIRRPTVAATVSLVIVGLLAAHVIRLGMAHQAYQSGTGVAQQRQFELAVEHLSLAIRLDPGKSLYHHSLAGAYFQLFQRAHDQSMAEAAITELRTAITLNPLDGRLQALLGFVYASIAKTFNMEDRQNQASILLQQAVAAYQSAAELEPFVYTHRIELGHLMLALGRHDAAEQHWRKAVELEPNYLPVRAALIRLYAKSAWTDQAEQQYQEIVARQRKYRSRMAGQLEQSFLHVDVSALDILRAGKVRAT